MNPSLRKLIPNLILRNQFLREVYRTTVAVPSLRRIWRYIETVGSERILWVLDTLEGEHGHALSYTEQKPVNKNNEPIPWYSYPAIEYISSIDFRQKTIFEYGSGNSSAFWARRCRQIVSVEDNKEWYEIVSTNRESNQKIILAEERTEYISACLEGDSRPDVIIVDGSHRFACAEAALEVLAPGGLIILDNSDWHPKTAEALRVAGLIQIDFTGFNPINYYVTTTSLFLHRDIQIAPRFDRMPQPGVGAGLHIEDPE